MRIDITIDVVRVKIYNIRYNKRDRFNIINYKIIFIFELINREEKSRIR